MAAQTKPAQVRIRIDDGDVELIDQLAGKAQSRTDVASVLLAAALDAIRRNKGRVHYWPPKLLVEDYDQGGLVLNEEASRKAHRK